MSAAQPGWRTNAGVIAAVIAAVLAATPLARAAVGLLQAPAAQGTTDFTASCATCHGADGRGAAGPSLVPFRFTPGELTTRVREGVGSRMPAIPASELSDTQIRGIEDYLRSLSANAPPSPARPAPAQGGSPAAAAEPVTVVAKRLPAAWRRVTDAMLDAPDPGDWLAWRRSVNGWGYSPLTDVTEENVGNLRLEWSWAVSAGPFQLAPVVHDGVMYVASPGNIVQALDGATGDLLWQYRPVMDERRRQGAQMRTLSLYADTVILGTVDGHILALDATNGSVRWDTPVQGPGGSLPSFNSAPIVADGVVVAGLAGCQTKGPDTCAIVGLNAQTGRLLWRTPTVAMPGTPGGDTWGDLPPEKRSGAEAWMPGSYDPRTGLVYWGTAQAKPWTRDARGTEGDALYSSSTLAIDPHTGAMKWFFQHVPGESYDMDEVFERVLVDYDGRSSVLTMGKLGILWELDRRTGKFLRALDMGYQDQVNVDAATGRASYRPRMVQKTGEPIYFCPGTGGLKTLRAMAYHPATQAVYIPLMLTCEKATFGMSSGAVTREDFFHPKSNDNLGEFVALDLRSGKPLWTQRRRAPYNTAALTTAGGVIFIGTWDRYALAYSAKTGKQLWEARLPTTANGFPITYTARGRQYVAMVAGASIGGSSWATIVPRSLLKDVINPSAGNGVFVFALPASSK